MKLKIVRFGILLASVLFALVIAEIIIRKINPQPTYSEAVKLSIDCYAAANDIPFTLARNHTCTMTNVSNEFYARAKLNSLGYRGKEFDLKKNEEIKRILVIGDSMTFGWGIEDDQTYPYQLEEKLRLQGYSNIEVINGGYVGGLSPDSYYVYLKKRGLELKPDLIIVGLFVWNDLADLSETVWDKVDKDGYPDVISDCCHVVDGKIFRNKVIDFKYQYPYLRESHLYLSFISYLQNNVHLFPQAALLAPKSEQILGCTMNPDCINKFNPEEQRMQKSMEGIKQLTDSQHIPLLTVLLPVDVQLYKESWSKYSRFNMVWFPKEREEDFIQKRITSFLDSKQIPSFDLYPYFMKNKDKGYPFFPIDAHFNPIGTKMTAQALSEFLHANAQRYGLK